MTAKEKIKEKLVELIGSTPCVGFSSRAAVEHVANWLVQNGVTVQEWISVKDRLPEDSTTVNLYTRSRTVGTGFYVKHTKSWVQYCSGGAICVDVTHWNPMPQPPKE